jgi:hypothetical protein
MVFKAPLYPDAVAVTNTYLRAALVAAGQAAPVVSQVPNPRPAKFVRVQRTGGPEVMTRLVDGAQLTVDSWAANDADAMDLAQLCRRLIAQMPGTVQSGVSVHRVVEFGGPNDLPDPVSSTPRVTFTVQVQMRGLAA